MNRFKELIDEMREHHKKEGVSESPKNSEQPQIDDSMKKGKDHQQFQLPYSSDPEPIGEIWK